MAMWAMTADMSSVLLTSDFTADEAVVISLPQARLKKLASETGVYHVLYVL